MSDSSWSNWFLWPEWWNFNRQVMNGEEITDLVLREDGTTVPRTLNQAALDELERRGTPVVSPQPSSGEVAPDAIAWVNTVTGETWIEPGG